jgi:hypothetical protein
VAISSVLVETSIPARLDRLRWGRFHTLVVVALVAPVIDHDGNF